MRRLQLSQVRVALDLALLDVDRRARRVTMDAASRDDQPVPNSPGNDGAGVVVAVSAPATGSREEKTRSG
jgi:NADPH:quinone reductase-like Zn-dependent oxidoreductase